MITRIREVRRARAMTLSDVAGRCNPPTTPQTIGRLETGARNVSVAWLNRIGDALGVEPEGLIGSADSSELSVAAVVNQNGATSARKNAALVAPRPGKGQIAVLVSGSVGDYRAGDELWCDTLKPQDYGLALNHDVLVPRPGERFSFGRLINRDAEKLQILALEPGGRQQVITTPPWLGVVKKLVRSF